MRSWPDKRIYEERGKCPRTSGGDVRGFMLGRERCLRGDVWRGKYLFPLFTGWVVPQFLLQNRAAVWLADYKSSKKSICSIVFSWGDSWRSLLTVHQVHQLQPEITCSMYSRPSDKRNSLVSLQQVFFASFQLWPPVELHAAVWKKDDHGLADSHFIILNTSIRSVWFLLSSKVHSLRWLILSSYGNFRRLRNN